MSRENKYTTNFKLKAVESVLKNNLSITKVCDNLAINRTDLRKWISYYKLYGISGLEPRVKNTIYSNDFKLSVIHSIDEEGLSLREATLRYNVPSTATVTNWYRIYQQKGAMELFTESRGRPKTMKKQTQRKYNKKPLTREEELLLENESLRAELALLKKLHALAQARKKNQ